MSIAAARVILPARDPALLVSRRVIGRRTVLSVSGELDFGSAPELADAIDGALADGALELWIDLSPATFMDSSGLHLLVDLWQRLAPMSRRLAIVCPRGAVRRVFDVAGVGDRLPLYDELAAAHLLT